MTGLIANILLNAVIVVLLAVTIGYCWVLNRRIKVLQDSRSELAVMLRHFDESTQRASESIIALQTASKKVGENIQFRIDKANYLMDDLSFMIEKGNKLANQMEAGFAVNRARNKVISEAPAAVAQEEYAAVAPVFKPQEKTQTHKERTAATLEAVLERVVGRNEKSTPEPKSQSRSRSKAEQELLDMIKAGVKG